MRSASDRIGVCGAIWAIAAVAAFVATSAHGQEPKLRAGAATSNVTPSLGAPIVGGFAPFPATHIHDELHARCLVLERGPTKVAIVVLDLLGIDRVVSDEARELIERDLGIPKSHVQISATHTHSACTALGKDARIVGMPADDYQRFVARRIADGVRRAVNDLRPAELAWGSAHAPEHVFNRRWHLKPGTMPDNPFGEKDQVKMNPGAGSKDLVEPAGPTDPEIPFLLVREPAGKPIALFATYSLHYVGGVGAGHVSADYFGRFCESVTRLFGAENQTPGFVALLANGTSGDINNINFRNPRPRQAPYEQIRHVADDVAKKVHAAAAKLTFSSDVALDARYAEFSVGTRRPTEAQLAWAKKTLAERPNVPGKTDLSRIYAERTQPMRPPPPKLPMPLQTLRIGEACIGSMPCEVFCEIGLEYKKRAGHPRAFLVSLNHGYYGYLPTPRQHALGGYETWLGTNRLEPTASDQMLAELLTMAKQLR